MTPFVWLLAQPAQAFTLFEQNFDWTATERYCTYTDGGEGSPVCSPVGTSNDTVGGAFELGALAQGAVLDSRKPATPTFAFVGGSNGAAIYRSDVLTLSHASNQLPTFNPDTNIEYLYIHPFDDDLGLTVDEDWFMVTPAAGLCLDICMLQGGLDDFAEAQSDWTLSLYSSGGSTLIADREGPGCIQWTSTGSKLWIHVADLSPALVHDTSKSLAHQYYRLLISNEDGEVPGVWRNDSDGDGFGEQQAGDPMCEPAGGGLVNNSSDCNDNDGDVFPGAPEVCNGVDDNCNSDIDERLSIGTWYADDDGDGYAAYGAEGHTYCVDPGAGYSFLPLDCDDTAGTGAAFHPGAAETCNGLDDDCDTVVDDGVPFTVYWPDTDDDGYGALGGTLIEACTQPDGSYAPNSDDCAPLDSTVHPGATEACDGVDQDCDGDLDDGFPCSLWFPDGDGDGYGDADGTPVAACEPPAATGWLSDGGADCDDASASIHAGVAETCDGLDQDCDGEIDEGLVTMWFTDGDGDGFGGNATATPACTAPTTTSVTTFGDCDDASAAANPDATEECNEVDDDCDGLVDEGCDPLDIETSGCGCATPVAPAPGALFLLPLLALIRRRGRAALAVGGLAAAVAPSRAEAFTFTVPRADWPETESYCGWNASGTLLERCLPHGVSNDQESGAFYLGEVPLLGVIDTAEHTPGTYSSTVMGSNNVALSHEPLGTDEIFDASFWFHYAHSVVGQITPDVDWYEVDTIENQCLTVCLDLSTAYASAPANLPADWTAVIRDDQGNTLGTAIGIDDAAECAEIVSPGGTLTIQVSDPTPAGAAADPKFMYRLTVDNATGLEGEFWPDLDDDGYGDMGETSVFYCGTPLPDLVGNDLDCDDDPATGATVGPYMAERCDGIDNDCDGTPDDGLPFADFWPDVDGDKWGDEDATPLHDCKVPNGHTVRVGDCDDTKETGTKVQPGQTEVCNSKDDDCDGRIDEGFGVPYWPDVDGDGAGDASATPTFYCVDPGTGWETTATDCDDADALISPSAIEVCNQIDDDCDGVVDDGLAMTTYYPDADADGSGAAECPESFCADPGDGWSTTHGDCDDGSAATFPGGTEVAGDGIDQDCSGADDCDGDDDGYVSTACGGDDCDDADAGVNPVALETFYDGVDADCAGDDDYDRDHDGHVDEAYADGYAGDLPTDDCNDGDDTIVLCYQLWVQGGLCATGVGPMAAWPVVALLALAMRRRRALALLAVPGVAVAQEEGPGFDSHGMAFLPHDGDLHDPLVVWRAERQVPMSFGLTGLFEYANDPAVLVAAYEDHQERIALVSDLVTFNLGGHFAFHERVGVAVSVPVWLYAAGEAVSGSAFGIGDLQLAVPVGIVLPHEDGTGFGLSAIPVLIAPIGAEGKLLGTPGFGGGGWLAAAYGVERFAVAADVGIIARAKGDYENLNGGSSLGFGLSASLALTEFMALRAEGLLRPTLSKNEITLTESPGEALLSLRGRYDSGFGWTVGGAVPFTRGYGAPQFRVFLGASWTLGKKPVRDRDGDGLVDESDTCPEEAEVVNGHADDDGCPDALATLRVRVLDPDGIPAANTPVILDGQQVGITDPDGWVAIADLPPGAQRSLSAQPDRDTATTLWDALPVTLAEGVQETTLTLGWLPGAVRVIAKDAVGAPIDAQLLFRGDEPHDPGRLGDFGVNVFLLSPGEWTILASADSFGTERRDVVIVPDQTSLVVIELVMLPAVVQITREEVLILEQIQFGFDSAVIQTASIEILEEVSNNLLTQPQIRKVEIQGHTDSDGSPKYNADLSQRRMESVVSYLVGRGVLRERIVPVGYGEDCPLVENTTEENKATNRRVQFIMWDPLESTCRHASLSIL